MKKQKKVKRKQINKRRRFFRILSRFLIFFLFIFLIIFSLKNSKLFNINSVNVDGAKKVSYNVIINKGNLKKGSKYFEISKSDRIKKLESIPYVKNAKVSYGIGGKVNVSVEERVPYYQVESRKYLLVDEDFRILEEKNSKVDNLLNLKGINVENKKPGSYILSYKEDEDKKLLLKSLKDSEYNLIGSIKEIELLDSVASFITVDGIKVEFGSYKNIDYKLKMLSLMLDDIKKTNKKATVIQMEKGTNPILIVEDEDTGSSNDKNDNENNEKTYIEEKVDKDEN